VRNLIALGAGSAGLMTHDEDHAGTTITIVDAGSLDRLLGSVGAPIGETSHLEIAFAVRDDLVAVGAPSFVRSALDANGDAALASNDRFQAAIGHVGADNAGFGWLDVSAVRGLVERLASTGMDRDHYEHDIKPYLEPLDSVVLANRSAADFDRGTYSIIVK
jgi:hypothetical protein